MARSVINSNPVEPLAGPNTGTGVEFGDSWAAAVTKVNAMTTDLYGGGLVAGASTQTFGSSGNINKLTATQNSGATNTTQTLSSYTAPANLFSAAGQELSITAWGTVAGNAAPKTIQLNVGAAFINTGTVTGSGFAWQLDGLYLCTSATAENYWLSGFGSGTASLTNKAGTDSVAITGTFAISVTCADASAASSNVSLLGFTVEYFA